MRLEERAVADVEGGVRGVRVEVAAPPEEAALLARRHTFLEKLQRLRRAAAPLAHLADVAFRREHAERIAAAREREVLEYLDRARENFLRAVEVAFDLLRHAEEAQREPRVVFLAELTRERKQLLARGSQLFALVRL